MTLQAHAGHDNLTFTRVRQSPAVRTRAARQPASIRWRDVAAAAFWAAVSISSEYATEGVERRRRWGRL